MVAMVIISLHYLVSIVFLLCVSSHDITLMEVSPPQTLHTLVGNLSLSLERMMGYSISLRGALPYNLYVLYLI